jgi:uridine kinase
VKPLVVGIAGGSASGKTTFIQRVSEKFNEAGQICVISQDHYYRPLSQQTVDENGKINFDRPEGIDFDRLITDLRKIIKGQTVKIAEYTFNNPDKFPATITFQPARIILIEGLFVYHNDALNQIFDLRLYLDADQEIAFQRRLKRDMEERGMTQEEVIYQWENHVVPAYEQFLAPHRDRMDLILMNNEHFNNSLEVIVSYFQWILNQ